MFEIFKLRTELIEAQRREILALKNVIYHLKEETRLLQKIQDVDRDEILRLHTEVAALKFSPKIEG